MRSLRRIAGARGVERALLLALACVAASLLLAPAASATFAYVTNNGAGTISAYSTNANGTLSPISCSGCAPGGAPFNIAITPNAKYLYATDTTNDRIDPYRINADGTLTELACSPTNCATGSGPYYVTASPDGRFLYVSNTYTNSITVYAIGSDGSLTAVPCPTCATGHGPSQIGLTPNGKFLYEPNSGNGSTPETVSVYSVNSNGTLTPVPCTTGCATGDSPEALGITPDGKHVYVGNYSSNSVSAYTIGSNGALTQVSCSGCATGSGPSALAVGPGGDLDVANYNDATLSPFSIGADGSLAPVACTGSSCDTGTGPIWVSFSPSGRFVYAINYGAQDVSVFAVGSGGSLTPVTCPSTDCNTGSQPYEVALTPDQAPTAAFTAHPARPGHPTSFNGSASTAAAGQTVAQYDWSFGDGTSADNAGPTPTHTYEKPGTYEVTLTVTDNAGCSTKLIYTGAQTLCNGGPSATITHTVEITAPISPTHLTVRPRRAYAGTRTCYAFRLTSNRRGISGAIIHFARHHRRTNRSGRARLCLTLKRGTYTARATKHGYRTARTTVKVGPARRVVGFTG